MLEPWQRAGPPPSVSMIDFRIRSVRKGQTSMRPWMSIQTRRGSVKQSESPTPREFNTRRQRLLVSGSVPSENRLDKNTKDVSAHGSRKWFLCWCSEHWHRFSSTPSLLGRDITPLSLASRHPKHPPFLSRPGRPRHRHLGQPLEGSPRRRKGPATGKAVEESREATSWEPFCDTF